ncbi:MAG: tyrosine-type recombinase/integrase [Proteobacteria bacterium]|nr:hypothetical protein [Pseudomonadota bacterium]NOG59400.1 tyrosine-type recombinase/integrase [Pseudomonadota bacterium]
MLKSHYRKISDKDALLLFDKYQQRIGRSNSTRRGYQSHLVYWSTFVDDLLHPSRNDLHRWLADRRCQISQSSLNGQLSALRQFYRWLYEFKYCVSDFSPYIPKPGRIKRLAEPRHLTPFELGCLLAAPDMTTLVGFRDHVMMRLMYETGLKSYELITLTFYSIEEIGFIRIYTAGLRDFRYVPISEEMSNLIKIWVDIRRTTIPRRIDILFVTNKGKPFSSSNSIWIIVNRYVQAALGLRRGYDTLLRTHKNVPWSHESPHLFRASFAHHLLQSGCDLIAVRDMMGHVDVKTTMTYLGIDLDYIKQEHAKLFMNC